LRNAGIRDSVVVESRPGRLEAVVLPEGDGPDEDRRAELDRAVKEANANLNPNQRIVAWRLWPEKDFPRTHTLKVKRDPVREWAASVTS
jgi:long-chain acyl-CoA synthetase